MSFFASFCSTPVNDKSVPVGGVKIGIFLLVTHSRFYSCTASRSGGVLFTAKLFSEPLSQDSGSAIPEFVT